MKHNNLIAIIGMILLVLVSYVVVAPGLDFTIDAISNDSVVNTSLETNVSMTETNETPVIETIPLNESELEEEMPELEVLPVEEQEVNETDPIEELPVVEPETNETITEDPIIEDLGDLNSTNSIPFFLKVSKYSSHSPQELIILTLYFFNIRHVFLRQNLTP